MTSSGFDETSFADVLAAAQRGDERAAQSLFVQLQPRLLRFLKAHEPRAADDIAAEVWLAVATRITQFEGTWADFRAWFFTIARRRLADHRRTAVRRRTDVVEAEVFELRPGRDNPEQAALDSLSGQDAARLITSSLSGDQAEVLLLRLLGDLDVDQVAGVMQRTPNWVRVTQHRAIRNLARLIDGEIVVIR
ncbi:MAG TPA: sigma-70 family RNA polymerase sigma factor [Ilumatobacteraceae bacterium]